MERVHYEVLFAELNFRKNSAVGSLACPGVDAPVPIARQSFAACTHFLCASKEKGRALRKPSLARADLAARGADIPTPPLRDDQTV
jgi:hypothetical protein